jgi:nitric oxide reductase large subunit
VARPRRAAAVRRPFEALDADAQALLRARLKREYRSNTFDAEPGTATVSALRAAAIARTADYYDRLFGADPALQGTRESYAMKENTLPDAERRRKMTGSSSGRPGRRPPSARVPAPPTPTTGRTNR